MTAARQRWDSMSNGQKARHLSGYCSADETHYFQASCGQYDWAVPAKYYKQLKDHDKRLPRGMPYPVPRYAPHTIDTHGWEPRSIDTNRHPALHMMLAKPHKSTWHDHEPTILWVLCKAYRAQIEYPTSNDKINDVNCPYYLTAVEQWAMRSYIRRANQWQIVSKMHRIGQMPTSSKQSHGQVDWRLCDQVIKQVLEPHIDRSIAYPVHRRYALPGSSEILLYLQRHHGTHSRPDENLRYLVEYLFDQAGVQRCALMVAKTISIPKPAVTKTLPAVKRRSESKPAATPVPRPSAAPASHPALKPSLPSRTVPTTAAATPTPAARTPIARAQRHVRFAKQLTTGPTRPAGPPNPTTSYRPIKPSDATKSLVCKPVISDTKTPYKPIVHTSRPLPARATHGARPVAMTQTKALRPAIGSNGVTVQIRRRDQGHYDQWRTWAQRGKYKHLDAKGLRRRVVGGRGRHGLHSHGSGRDRDCEMMRLGRYDC